MTLSKESFNAYSEAKYERNFNKFIDYMDPIIKEYNQMISTPPVRKWLGKIKREIKSLIKR